MNRTADCPACGNWCYVHTVEDGAEYFVCNDHGVFLISLAGPKLLADYAAAHRELANIG